MKIIGLTGGIGSGKSTVTNYLLEKGFEVLDADKIAREIVLPGSDTLIELTAKFGKDILLEDGSLNRKKLGEIVFGDVEKKAVLDKIMHSRILEIIYSKILMFRESAEIMNQKNPDIKQAKVIFIDAPLLFETRLDEHVSEVWVVDADDETRITRVMERDGLSREEIVSRIAVQMDRNQKIERANEILDNSGEREALYHQIDLLLEKI
ncbi:dephospho-CoA kinase [Sinanaerobacter chloroacetimidivorans]|jgi:dephospho-CoA kinase|uniref:Dephospho-CoA kinase n=1 Tax=Sinanaerobacter chloroacetimidivorans TaxID=2818044 RepID=A0A8J7VZY1_9FIRM|nr:dephospho-CoA kinase [Sinanaerobacter chloroacetimidivorans]MBR0596700.1 dephospho-CoA kinase [Sinanaerobacter chloroacetimidivorans]